MTAKLFYMLDVYNTPQKVYLGGKKKKKTEERKDRGSLQNFP